MAAAVSGYAQLAEVCETISREAGTIRWPDPRYARDIAGFARDILGIEPWEGQLRIFKALEEPESSVLVRAGTKVGKTNSIAIEALWFYCTVPECQVAFTASTAPQAQATIWREIGLLKAKAGRCVACRKAGYEGPIPCPHSARIDGHIAPDFEAGLKSADGTRWVRGVVSNKEDAYAGISGGSKLLLIGDEATGINDTNIAYFRGNRHGAREIWYANPTRTDGWFYEAHTPRNREMHVLLHLSTYEAADTGIDGLATHKTIREAEIDLGEDSPIFIAKYKGEFPTQESLKLVSMHDIASAVSRWPTMPTPVDAPLIAGLDPAGLGDDRSVLVLRRGDKVLDIQDRGQLDENEVADFTIEVIRQHMRPGERPELRYDATGTVGAEVGRALREYAAEVKLIAMIANGEPTKKDQFRRLRDQLWWVGRMWLREGGAIPDHGRLQTELHAPNHSTDEANRIVVEEKKVLKKRLGGKSPDFADAFCLCAWNDPSHLHKPVIPYSPEANKSPDRIVPYAHARDTREQARALVYGNRRRR